MEEVKYYDNAFYTEQKEGSYISAKIILPIVYDALHPKSVLDIGCGVGYWLKVWKDDLSITDLLGIEGTYVTEELFQLDKKYLQTADLKRPLNLNRKFDLVTTLEVAEHIPQNYADTFVLNLVNAGDVVLFSAAIVGQIGTHHVNEQMPEYWAEKFLIHDYIPIDYIRPIIWNFKQIQYWYRQNILIFIKRNRLPDFPKLSLAAQTTNPEYLSRIHPEKYFAYVNETNQLQTIAGFIKYKLYRLKLIIKSLGK